MDKIHQRGLEVSAFSCHNNPIAPDEAEAKEADETLRKTIQLAALLGVPVVNTFSGIAGSDDSAKYPNWPVTLGQQLILKFMIINGIKSSFHIGKI